MVNSAVLKGKDGSPTRTKPTELFRQNIAVLVEFRSKEKSYGTDVPDSVYITNNYKLCCTLGGKGSVGKSVFGKVQAVDAENGEEIVVDNQPVLQTDLLEVPFNRAAVFKIKFLKTSYHANGAYFRLRLQFLETADARSPVLSYLSPEFKVYSKKKNTPKDRNSFPYALNPKMLQNVWANEETSSVASMDVDMGGTESPQPVQPFLIETFSNMHTFDRKSCPHEIPTPGLKRTGSGLTPPAVNRKKRSQTYHMGTPHPNFSEFHVGSSQMMEVENDEETRSTMSIDSSRFLREVKNPSPFGSILSTSDQMDPEKRERRKSVRLVGITEMVGSKETSGESSEGESSGMDIDPQVEKMMQQAREIRRQQRKSSLIK